MAGGRANDRRSRRRPALCTPYIASDNRKHTSTFQLSACQRAEQPAVAIGRGYGLKSLIWSIESDSRRVSTGYFTLPSLHAGSPSSTPLLSVDVEESFHKQDSFTSLVAVWDGTCVPARTHWLGKYKKHERGRAASVSHCNRRTTLSTCTLKAYGERTDCTDYSGTRL
ncbi:hypothetical protein AV530_012243 [Patagioenas fasciata monilis]|uniref:Uncharacterized protein n=1 Tax=Patagioenas fasciata monilis TaxID=372326 RepID=A0A1V4J8C3_PATFA|nr:hypothetical protein AV530_012243 [Patagioenas fasciata monilis]